MKRKVMEALLKWKGRADKQPLIIHGVRQAGKTYIIKEFGEKYYKNVIYVNLETDQRVASFFEEDIAPLRIIRYLESSYNGEIFPGETLLVFDEIQTCQGALTSLKYFCEQTPQYHIIAAGSLLGVAINREKHSFPVGKVESLALFPMDFEEFLWAINRDRICAEIRNCYENNVKMPQALHSQLLELYKLYLIIGGMPKVVREYANTGKLINIVEMQNEILNNYIADMAKYASNSESVKIRACYNSIPGQLAKDNKKFQYKVVQKGGNAGIFGSAIEWLNFAGVVQKCQKITQGTMPIAVYSDMSSFKLYMGDAGMLTMKSGMAHSTILSNLEIDNTFIGAIAENYVAVALATNGYPLYYWQSDNTAEVDFVIQKDDMVIPVEVKAGKNTQSRSLSVYIQKYKPDYAIRISTKNFGFENDIKSVPVYSVFCI